MQSFIHSVSGGRHGVSRRRITITGLLAVVVLAFAAPSAFAWHAHLRVTKVNLGGPSSDVFTFKIEKTPNLYEDIWKDGHKTFELQGAPTEAGPWYERYSDGPYPIGANMESFGDLWAGFDHGFEDWVTYKVTEVSSSSSPLSDYTTTASCTINRMKVVDGYETWTPEGAEFWTTDNAVTQQYGQWSYTTGVEDGKTNVATSVRWMDEVRYATICNFVNRYRARVRVKKTFTDPITAQPSVSADINGSVRIRAGADGTPAAPADSTLEHGENTEWVKIPVGPNGPTAPVVVGESDGDAGDPPLTDYNATIDCGEGITATRDAQTGKWTLGGIQPGQDVTCTIHNTRKPGPPNEPPTTPPTTPPGTPPTTPPGTTTTGSTPSDVASQVTSGVTRPRARARVTGTVGCATARYASASISGSQIKRVTFYVNGRKAKTVSRPNAGKAYRLRYVTKGLRNGSYAVRARVEFTSASKASPRNFNLQFSRCSQRAVQPTFTG